MAKTPNNKKGDRLIVYPKQWPDTRVDKAEIDKDEPVTPHLGHEYRLRKKFSEEADMEEQTVPGRPKGARETFSKRFRFTRAKHMPHPAPIKGGHYKSTPQMEKPHYEEYDMNESSMTVWKHKTKDVSVDWNKHGAKFTVHVKGDKVSGHATEKSAVAAANRRAKQMDESKTYNQFVTEAAKRGRPRKLRPGEEADTLHIQDQLNKLTHPNHVEVHFKDGSKHRIPREHANMALHHLAGLKPIERSEHAEHMGKSHSDFYHVLSRKSVPSKSKGISLAGPKLRKEETDDGWYAHKEMHGSKAVSKEDWKKGVRLNRDGKRVQMKKEEAEQIDEWGKQAITGPHASTASKAITPPKVGYKGKQKKTKVQDLNTEEHVTFKRLKESLMNKAASLKHPDEASTTSQKKQPSGEKPTSMKDPVKYSKREVK